MLLQCCNGTMVLKKGHAKAKPVQFKSDGLMSVCRGCEGVWMIFQGIGDVESIEAAAAIICR